MGPTPDATDPLAALGIGALVALRQETGEVRPALVVASDAFALTLHVARRPEIRPREPVTVAFSVHGQVHELRTRVSAAAPGSAEVAVERGPVQERHAERRDVDRFPLVAEALLVLASGEYAGRSTDVSVLGAGLVVSGAAPATGEEGELLLHDAGEELVPGARVRVAFAERLAPAGRWRVGVEFASPRAPDVTARLLAAVDPR